MTEFDEPLGKERIMNEEEQQIAQMIHGSIWRATHDSERSEQAKAFVIGVSDLGTCSERTRRRMAGIGEPETDKLEAFIGSWVGTGVEAAVSYSHPDTRCQDVVTVTLHGDGGDYEISGHPDLVHPWGVGDVKTVDGLTVIKRTGPSQQQLFQRHLLTLGAHEAGMLSVPLDEAKTYNVWLDRSGRTKEVYVHMDHFSQDVVDEATRWLDEVVYAYRNSSEAMKEPPRTWCEKVCGHFHDCRMYDTDVEGLILDPEIQAAAEAYKEAKALEKRAKIMTDDAKGVLTGVNGYVRGFQIRNTWVNPSEYEVQRQGYYRLSVTPMKGKS